MSFHISCSSKRRLTATPAACARLDLSCRCPLAAVPLAPTPLRLNRSNATHGRLWQARLILTLCLAITGCASLKQPFAQKQKQSPVTLAQWSWGKSVDLKKKNSDSFVKQDEEQQAETDDVTVVDPDAEPEAAAPKSKEPRKLWAFGKNANQPPEPVRPHEPQESKSNSSWLTKTPSNSSKSALAPVVVDETEERQRKAQYSQAEALYKDGKLAEAESVLKPLTKKKKNFWSNLRIWSADPGTREEHNRVREDSLFLLAESYFKQERFSDAKGNYEALLKDYPSTRHLNVATRRLFVIGKTWLGMPDFATTSDITPVNVEDPRSTPQPKKQKPPHSAILVPNITDKTRPAFDTPGHALEALKSIWLYDPRGPLADDAIMLTASHYLRVGNYQEADRYFSMLREEYPSSPHLQTSFVLGSHVKLMSYQGADYDEKQLEDARRLKESTLRLFPNLPERERLKDELARIEEARAQRYWELVELYRRKGKPKAMVIYAEDVLQRYPNSSYAPKAREVLAELRPELLEKYPGAQISTRKKPRLSKASDDDEEISSGNATL